MFVQAQVAGRDEDVSKLRLLACLADHSLAHLFLTERYLRPESLHSQG